MFEKYNFGTDFQDLLLACIIQKPEKFMHNVGTLNSAYFYGVERIAAARALFAYWRKNHKFPAKNALCQIVYDSIVRSSDAKEEDNINKYVEKLRDMDTSDADYVVERVVAFARERALYIAIEKSHEFLVAGETPPGGYGKMFEDALKIGAMGDPFYSLGELATGIIDDNQTLLGNRFLCRGGGLLQISYTGVGKSTVGIQQDMLWALGKPAIGIKPARPLRILCIQAENDRDDQIEAASGIAAGLRLSQADLNQISESTRYIYHSAKTGGEFIDTVLQPALSRFPCDLVRLDPLIAYVGGDISKPDVVAAFLRNGLNPVLARHQAGCIINHHTPKPTAETTKFKRKLSEWVYAAAGSYDLMGWARAALVFTPTSEPSVFRFIAAKRGQRIGWEVGGQRMFERYFAHSKEGICWQEATAEQIAAATAGAKGNRGGAEEKYPPSRLLSVLEDSGPLRYSDFLQTAKAQGWSESTFDRKFNSLRDDGRIVSRNGVWMVAPTSGSEGKGD